MTSDSDGDRTDALVDAVRAASSTATPLRIVGGDTKRFYGRHVDGQVFDVSGHSGVTNYDPAELVVTARAGTRLAEVEALLARHGQWLPFEPPAFGDRATIGGTVAAGLAGPARAARGPVRDYVLGARLLTGDGRVLRFGGEVMKNVAGYDVSRLLAGSLGVLGVILDVSLKVLPRPAAALTLRRSIEAQQALGLIAGCARRALPLTASFWCAGELSLRFEGAPAALDVIEATAGGDRLAQSEATTFWMNVREQRLPFFRDAPGHLWRDWAAVDAPLPGVPAHRFAFEWNGMQRWTIGKDTDVQPPVDTPDMIRTLFRSAPGTATREVFASLPEPLLNLHRAIRRVFDPAGILNPGRMYATL